MPSVLSRLNELKNKFYDNAPKKNQPKIEKVLEMYKDKANMNFKVVQNMVIALYSPSLFGREKVEKMYENFLSKYQNEEAFPISWTRGMTNKEKLQERRDHPWDQAELPAARRALHAGEEVGPKEEG